MRLHIIRHGDPDYAADSLTDRGRREASCLRSWVARERPERAYCSPMGRARLTAELALDGSGLTAAVEDWTAELRDARADGLALTWWDVHGHLLRNPAYLASGDWADLPPLSSTLARAELARIAAASDAFLARHGVVRDGGSYRLGTRPCASIAVFCHGGFGLCWLAHLLALPAPLVWAGFMLHTSSVTTLLFDEREPGIATPRVLHLGDVGHLHAAGIEPSTSGIKANYR
ncbi:MAG: histidine phosphatase family protein [Planctomycetes bacterium]|nr:histidine phosphatase family protein [Planctomycetota bacterium]